MLASISSYTVQLPRSANSQGLSYAILIHRIRTECILGDAFEGRRFRPGVTVAEKDLWPTPDHPETPLLLEYVGSDRSGHGHRRSQHLYILWQYRNRQWKEIVRASAEALEWIDVIRPVALRYLASKESRESGVSPAVSAASRVLAVLRSELDHIGMSDRRNFLGLLYEQFTAQLSHYES
jgi:hypothetical protein